MKRKTLVCLLIATAAVVTITGTAMIRISRGNGTSQVADQPLAPGITFSLLTETELRSVTGDDDIVTTQAYGRMPKTPPSVDPAVCEGVALVPAPGTFAGIDWVAMRFRDGRSPGQHSHYAAQGLTALPTADAAQGYIDKAAQSWQQCNGHSYSTKAGDATNRWQMTTFNQTGSLLTAMSSIENSTWACQHVLTVNFNFVIDVQACGYDTTNQARVIADRIAGKLNTNRQTA